MSAPSMAAEVVVIGGGPAGSTTAAMLAREGHRVVLLEREKFPRYHIGESLITGCISVVQDMGVWDRMGELGFTRKYGGTLLWGAEEEPWGFRFAEGGEYEHSYQVRRADFDALLLARARELGVTVVEEATVRDVEFSGDRAVGVTFVRRGGDEPERIASTMVVDASGQGRVVGRRLDLVDWHEDLRNVAVWNYFQGCELLEGEKAGDIFIEDMPAGWFWFIPLHDGTVSLGYVTSTEALKASDRSPEELFAEVLSRSRRVQHMIRDAHAVSSFRTTRDWSYTCTRFHGPGWLLVGDAAAFIDPLLSTGVTLAMRGARSAARAIDEALKNPSLAKKAFEEYEQSYRDFLASILGFVRFFYNKTKLKDEYHGHAQELIDPTKLNTADVDFATLLSGLSVLVKGSPGLDMSIRD